MTQMTELPDGVYLDNAASTPVDPRVVARMMACLQPHGCGGVHANPAALNHVWGQQARQWIEHARAQVAALIAAPTAGVIFTSGATESNNLALLGAARFHGRGHIVSTKTEHKSVLEPLKRLEKEGFKVTYLKPDAMGVVQPEQVIAALTAETILVSLMHVNNELGVIQDVAPVGRVCRARGVLLHVDAAQSVGRVPVDVDAMNIDLLSLTAHKFYGPKGVGALYVRRQPPLGLQPVMWGGGQEQGLRAGTLATHQIVGLGEACALVLAEGATDNARITTLREQLWQGIHALGGVILNGHPTQRVANIINVSFTDVEGESLQYALRTLAVSAGAACSAGTEEASYVLRALGRSDTLALSSLRFSLGRFTTAAEIADALHLMQQVIPRLRTIVKGSA